MTKPIVTWNNKVDKSLIRIPSYIRDKFMAWAMAVERIGIQEVRKLSGFHDEPLRGKRQGQKSIRLSRAYRAIYQEKADGRCKIIEVIEVSKHEY